MMVPEVPSVETPSLQILLRRAILEVAVTEAINKFTGEGHGENKILRTSAENLVATAMAVINAEFNKTYITVGDTKYHACDYTTYGSGLATLMNWNGKVYISEIDDEKPEQAIITAKKMEYVNDSYTTHDGNVKYAGGQVVSPTRWEKLWDSFNGLQGKVGDSNKISTGQSVDKGAYFMNEVQYVFQGGEMRVLHHQDATDMKLTQEVATIMEAELKFAAPTIGEESSKRAEQKIIEWLL